VTTATSGKTAAVNLPIFRAYFHASSWICSSAESIASMSFDCAAVTMAENASDNSDPSARTTVRGISWKTKRSPEIRQSGIHHFRNAVQAES